MQQYREISVTYTLDEHQQRQLAALGEALHEDDLEGLFARIMQIGSTYDIAWKFALREYTSGLRKEFPTQDMVNAETRERLSKQEA
jgi:hypothetical protein